jgi:hypothetical protein
VVDLVVELAVPAGDIDASVLWEVRELHLEHVGRDDDLPVGVGQKGVADFDVEAETFGLYLPAYATEGVETKADLRVVSR